MVTEDEFLSIMEYTRKQLRAHMFPMVHSNGYGVEACPKATIESLPALIKYKEWIVVKSEQDSQWCKGYEARALQEKFNDIGNGGD